MKKGLTLLIALLLFCLFIKTVSAQSHTPDKGKTNWEPRAKLVEIQSSLDGSMQKAYFYDSKSKKKKPLIIGLHSWSTDYQYKPDIEYLNESIDRDWVMIHPDYRGPNTTIDAGGSKKVIQDILDARDFAIKNANIDLSKIYLAGVSGGGHAALLMLANKPKKFDKVIAWVPITNLRKWYKWIKSSRPDLQYADNIEVLCGGNPLTNKTARLNCKKRSSIFKLRQNMKPDVHILPVIHYSHSS